MTHVTPISSYVKGFGQLFVALHHARRGTGKALPDKGLASSQSTVAPLSFTTLDHLACSAWMNLAKFSGVSPTYSEPVSL